MPLRPSTLPLRKTIWLRVPSTTRPAGCRRAHPGQRCPLGDRGRLRRTQLEVAVQGDTADLARQLKGFHWMVCYGDHLRETGYALKKAGVEWLPAS